MERTCRCAFHGRRFYALGQPTTGYAAVEVTVSADHRITFRVAEQRHATLADAETEARTYCKGRTFVAWHPAR